MLCGVSRQLRERHTKLEDFASWLGLLRRVQAGEVQRLQQEETALALWDMYLAYGGKPMLEQHQDKLDEMKEESAAFTKVLQPCSLLCNGNFGASEAKHTDVIIGAACAWAVMAQRNQQCAFKVLCLSVCLSLRLHICLSQEKDKVCLLAMASVQAC